jgi:hypothetical protein
MTDDKMVRNRRAIAFGINKCRNNVIIEDSPEITSHYIDGGGNVPS